MFVRILRYDSIDVSILIMGDSMRSKFARLIAAVLLLCSIHLFCQELIVSAAASLTMHSRNVGELSRSRIRGQGYFQFCRFWRIVGPD